MGQLRSFDAMGLTLVLCASARLLNNKDSIVLRPELRLLLLEAATAQAPQFNPQDCSHARIRRPRAAKTSPARTPRRRSWRP